MTALKLRRSRDRRTRELASWQAAAIGLLVLSVAVNVGMMARITSLEQDLEAEASLRQTDTAIYEQKIEQTERRLDRAIQERATLSALWAEDLDAREMQARAYEAVGKYRYIGECTITAYCPCEECCGRWADGLTATGLTAGPGIVSVDPEVIPLGSTVIIDGQRYLAADTGVEGLHVGVCMAEHEDTVEAGVGTADVWVVRP